MNMELMVAPDQHVKFGAKALHELKALVHRRPDSEKLVINGKQYLYFSDWQILGAFFGITTWVTDTSELTKDKPGSEGITFKEIIGYKARAIAKRNGEEISAAEAICTREEPNWKGKPSFQLLSMAQTRACAKALRNCLQWVVRLPDERQPDTVFAEEAAEELNGEQKQGRF